MLPFKSFSMASITVRIVQPSSLFPKYFPHPKPKCCAHKATTPHSRLSSAPDNPSSSIDLCEFAYSRYFM